MATILFPSASITWIRFSGLQRSGVALSAFFRACALNWSAPRVNGTMQLNLTAVKCAKDRGRVRPPRQIVFRWLRHVPMALLLCLDD